MALIRQTDATRANWRPNVAKMISKQPGQKATRAGPLYFKRGEVYALGRLRPQAADLRLVLRLQLFLCACLSRRHMPAFAANVDKRAHVVPIADLPRPVIRAWQCSRLCAAADHRSKSLQFVVPADAVVTLIRVVSDARYGCGVPQDFL